MNTIINTSIANLTLINANIITLDPIQPKADWVMIDNNKIQSLGCEKPLRKNIIPKAEIMDCRGMTVIPGSIDISLGGIHNIVVGSDIDKTFQKPVSVKDLSGIMADGIGVKQQKGRQGELRNVIGITKADRVEPLGCFTNSTWPR